MIDYLRDPAEIYRRSFATIRAETDLARLPADIVPVAVRLVHACGMPDIVRDLAWSHDAVTAGRAALGAARRSCAIRAWWPRALSAAACRARTTSSACSISTVRPSLPRARTRRAPPPAWRLAGPRLKGAIVAIGNAPTALFRLLEELDAGAAAPALILAFPVGFIGAAESKHELIHNPRGVPFIALRGRRGGSALAAAAVNALFIDETAA